MKINQLKAGATLSYISMILGYMISIIYTPFMLRLLGRSEYGLYNLVASIVAYLGVLNFGFGSAYIRYYMKYKKSGKDDIAKLNGMFLIIFTIMGLIAIIAGVILALNTPLIIGNRLTDHELSKASVLMSILVVNLALSFPNMIFDSYIIANERFIFWNCVQMIKIIVSPFVVLPLLILGYGSVGMVLATTILYAGIVMINIIYSLRKLQMKFDFRKFDMILFREITVFSSFIFINLVIDQINWNVDKFILGRYSGTISVAIYGLAAQLNAYYLSMSTAISNVFIPKIHRLVINSDDNELTMLFTRIGRIQFIILSLISTGFIFFGRQFIYLWVGNDYVDSYPIALLLIVPVTIPLIQNIGIEIQRAKNMHHFRSWVYFFIALGNISISIPLAKMYGGIGAAFGTAISLIIGNGLIMNWYNHVKVGLNMKFFWLQIVNFVPALIIPILTGVLMINLFRINSIFLLLTFGMTYVIIFFISMWNIGMNQFEKDLVLKPVKNYIQN